MASPRTDINGVAALSVVHPARIVAVAADAGDLDAAATALSGLASIGHRVTLVWMRGEPGGRLTKFTSRVRVTATTGHGLRARVRAAGRSALRRREDPFADAVRRDPGAQHALQGAAGVAPVGHDAWVIAGELSAGASLISPEELREWARVPDLWRVVKRRGEKHFLPHDIRDAGPLLADLDELGVRVPAQHQHLLVRWVEALHAVGEYDLASGLVAQLDEDAPTDHPADRVLRRGLRLLVSISAEGTEQPGLRETVRELVSAADSMVEQADTTRVVAAATLALQLLFHRELHADVTSSPLVEDPGTFLADWRGSQVGALLAQPVPQTPALHRGTVPTAASVARAGQGEARSPRVVVVPGTYPQFVSPVIDALRERASVHVAELRHRPELRGLGTQKELVGARLRLALGQPWHPDLELVEEMEAADLVFIDWADRGSLAALMSVPHGVPVVLRIHSMDALSPWIHLLDWSRVQDLILVSDHLRDLVVRVLGERLSGTRVQVVPNVLDPRRLPTHKTEGHRRRLLMVGWAQRVKDPLWALEILAGLREQDPGWRLRLVGNDFTPGAVRSERAYAREFWARLAEEDVRDGVDFVGYTRDLAPHLAGAGFMLSTSRRESFGLGLVEGAASGAVPVVRDWPMFASLGGARGLFPDDWVVDSTEQAVSRIRSLSGAQDWARASEAARATVRERFASDSTRSLIQELVLSRV